MAQTTVPEAGSWRTQYNDIIRSFAGSFLFGIPFIYAIEMWWIATYLELWKLLTFLLIAAGINIVLAHLIYLKEATPWHVAVGEALFNFAVGIVGAAFILFILGRFVIDDPLREILGKILLEAIPLSIGAAVTHRVERRRQAEQRQRERAFAGQPRGWRPMVTEASVTAAGALFLSLPLASADEIRVLAAGIVRWQTIAVALFSLLAVSMTIYRNRLEPSPKDEEAESRLPLFADTLMTYSIALLTAALILFLFDRIDVGDPLLHVATQTVVLALPAAVGGAAGRRLL